MKKSTLASVIAIAILLITGLFLFFQNQDLKQKIDVLNQKINELQKVKPEPVAEKIPEGWKEYADEEYKFKIWYPNNNDTTIVYKYVNYKNINTIDFSIPNPNDMSLGLLRIYI